MLAENKDQIDGCFAKALKALDKAKDAVDAVNDSAAFFAKVTGNSNSSITVRQFEFLDRTMALVDGLVDIERDLQILRRAANATIDLALQRDKVAHLGNTPK